MTNDARDDLKTALRYDLTSFIHRSFQTIVPAAEGMKLTF